MGLGARLARLEQATTGGAGAGAGVVGVMRVDHRTGTGPDAVTVTGTGAALTEAGFRARYPRGLLVLRQEYGGPTGDGAA